jgi:hypothetical protein
MQTVLRLYGISLQRLDWVIRKNHNPAKIFYGILRVYATCVLTDS